MEVNNRAEMAAVTERFVAGLSRGDTAGMAACYTKDFMVMPTNRDIITSIPEFQKFWQGVLDLGVKAAFKKSSSLRYSRDIRVNIGNVQC